MNLIRNRNSNCVENFKQKQINTAWVPAIGMQCETGTQVKCYTLIDHQSLTCIVTQSVISTSNFISDEFLLVFFFKHCVD